MKRYAPIAVGAALLAAAALLRDDPAVPAAVESRRVAPPAPIRPPRIEPAPVEPEEPPLQKARTTLQTVTDVEARVECVRELARVKTSSADAYLDELMRSETETWPVRTTAAELLAAQDPAIAAAIIDDMTLPELIRVHVHTAVTFHGVGR